MIESGKIESLDFRVTAKKIYFEVSCTKNCHVYLLNSFNLQELKENRPFESFFKKELTTLISFGFEDETVINRGLFITVLNPLNNGSLIAEIQRLQYFSETDLSYFLYIGIGIGCFLIFQFLWISILYFCYGNLKINSKSLFSSQMLA